MGGEHRQSPWVVNGSRTACGLERNAVAYLGQFSLIRFSDVAPVALAASWHGDHPMAETGTKQAQWQKLFGDLFGNQAAWVADVGLKAGLFRAIADAGEAGLTEGDLAMRLHYHPRYVRVWCRAAYAFELFDWDETARHRLAPHMADLLLDPTDPQFMGDRLQFYTALYEGFRSFPDYLRSGST